MTEMNTENKLEAMQRANGPLLEVKNLQVDFTTDDGQPVHAVRNSSFSVYPGQWVAIVGESGSGKSTSAMAVLGLLPGTGHVVGGSIKLDGEEISGYKQRDFDKLRGNKMGLVPQDPMSNLNPVWRIGTQVKELWPPTIWISPMRSVPRCRRLSPMPMSNLKATTMKLSLAPRSFLSCCPRRRKRCPRSVRPATTSTRPWRTSSRSGSQDLKRVGAWPTT